jgi:hypothetical protein
MEPPALATIIVRGISGVMAMARWHDTMVDRPEDNEASYAAGWTISGLAVVGAILAVWVFAI